MMMREIRDWKMVFKSIVMYLFLILFFNKQNVSSGMSYEYISCYDGAYQVQLPPFNSCSGYRDCEIGSYCVNGIKLPCPAGFYGDRPRLNSSYCSGICPAGYYCLTGTTRATTFPCGGSNLYCPLGSQTALPVPKGYYSIDKNGTDNLETVNTRVSVVECPFGHYCTNGMKFACPAGRFGNMKGLSDANCSGLCVEGYYCPEGSVSPFEISCGDSPVVYCPAESGRPNRTALGYYALRTHESVKYGSGYVYQEMCPLGSYCIDGVRYLCPAGRYGMKIRETNASCTGACMGGFYCPLGSSTSTQFQCNQPDIYCPPGSPAPLNVSVGYYTINWDTRTERPFQDFYTTLLESFGNSVFQGYAFTNQTICEPGYYCIGDGIKRSCPPGRYGSTYGLNNSLCTGYCDQGYYCPETSISSKQNPCGGANLFCPRGSYQPQLVSHGYYSIGGNSALTRINERLCEPGFYCQNGTKSLCLAGYYGSTFGLEEATCTGACSPGYYCPDGSISATEIMCGDASRYCPGNSPQPINVTLGWFTIGGNESTRISQAIAPAGYFALQGLLYPCPAGYYGAKQGLYSPFCSGLCSIPGFYCPTGSISPLMRYCGGDNYFCPPGSVAPLNVQIGFYTTDYQYEACPPGQWRNLTVPPIDFTVLPYSAVPTINQLPLCELCPEGTFKATSGDNFELCRPCDLRNSMSSSDRQICVCTRVYETGFIGYFNISTGLCNELEISSIAAIDASAWQTNISLTRYQQYPCEPGYYCQNGLRFLCPAGYYGARSEEIRANCTNLCAQGYYCPVGSTSPFMIPCGAANLICPIGSPFPIIVPPGYYTNEEVREDLRFIKYLCPTGFYCPGDGRRYQCPTGTYASQEGTISDQCMGPCEKGYYCLVGSSTPIQYPCGNSTVYCPTGSSQPQPVHEGYYSSHTGVSAGSDAFWDTDNSTCSVELPCEPGYFCTGGIKQPCPPGTFGWRYGLHTAQCDGQCAAGYYCPSYLPPQPGAPPITVWPMKPHIRPDDLPCSDVNYYCPRGSTYPTPVQRGYYSIGGNPNNLTRRGEIICPPGSYCDHAIARLCPSGRFGSTSGLADSSCTDGCPAGYYCPSGCITPFVCPDQTYSTGLTSSCTPCPGIRTTPLKCQTDSSCCLRY